MILRRACGRAISFGEPVIIAADVSARKAFLGEAAPDQSRAPALDFQLAPFLSALMHALARGEGKIIRLQFIDIDIDWRATGRRRLRRGLRRRRVLRGRRLFELRTARRLRRGGPGPARK